MDIGWLRKAFFASDDLAEALERASPRLCREMGASWVSVYQAAFEDLDIVIACGERVKGEQFPRGTSSVAGYVRQVGRIVSIPDTADEAALAAFDPPLRISAALARRAGYLSGRVLAAPIFHAAERSVLGVLEVVRRADEPAFEESSAIAVRGICELVATRWVGGEAARRNSFGPSAQLTPEHLELLSIPQLRMRAEGSMRREAPESAAQAREALLAMHRRRLRQSGHLALYGIRESRHEPWGGSDYDGFEWLCRLAATGHVGAARLAEKARLAVADFPIGRMKVLANTYPIAARKLALAECERKTVNGAALLDWLALSSTAHAAVVSALRALYPDLAFPDGALRLLRGHLREARERGEERMAAEVASLVVDLAIDRLAAGPHGDAEALVRAAADTGSTRARAYLWSRDLQAAADRGAFLRDWLDAHPDPADTPRAACFQVAVALDEGLAGAGPDPEAAFAWYGRCLQNPIRTAASYRRIGDALLAARPKSPLAVAWYWRGAEMGDGACARLWFEHAPDVSLDGLIEGMEVLAQRGMSPWDSHRKARSAEMKSWTKYVARMESDPPDPAAASRYLRLCALLGNEIAQLRLAACYEAGFGVARDTNEARKWRERAAALGVAVHPVPLQGPFNRTEQIIFIGRFVDELREAERRLDALLEEPTPQETALARRALLEVKRREARALEDELD